MTSAMRVLRRPARVLKQIVAPTGRHRLRPVLLPDEPIPAPVWPITHQVLGEAELTRLLDDGTAEVLSSARCPCCDRFTAHAVPKDGPRRCWECGTESPAGAA